jgi:hypothetical protein
MDTIVFRINPDGTMLALSGSGAEEALDLRTSGRLAVRRASYVCFDETTQTWGWGSTDGERSGSGFPTRLVTVVDEIRTLSEAL